MINMEAERANWLLFKVKKYADTAISMGNGEEPEDMVPIMHDIQLRDLLDARDVAYEEAIASADEPSLRMLDHVMDDGILAMAGFIGHVAVNCTPGQASARVELLRQMVEGINKVKGDEEEEDA